MSPPLDGIRVLDLTRLLPGGVCSMMLADLGADVVKIEDPNGGDYARWMPPLVNDQSVYFRMNNRSKRSVVLNLKDERGQAVLRRLVERADVLIEGFRPGVLDRLGCGYMALKAVNPRLIYCALSGWGQDGPYAERSGHDLNYVSALGITGAMGTPQPMGGEIADIGGAYIGVAGILAALFRRERTGEGGVVDVALSESALPFALYPIIEALALDLPGGTGALTGALACYNVYWSKDGKALSLAALEPKFWANFATAVQRPDLLEGSYQDPERQPELKQKLTALFASKTAAEWCALLENADCCFMPVVSPRAVIDDPQVQARGMMGRSDDDTAWMRSPIRIDGDGFAVRPSPGYGEHTRVILREAGYSDADIDALVAAGVAKEAEKP
jgi:crotonobetainyl-CoA:carnitine CoA-transferase CaiB-like acyl-CoA transferase